MKNNIVLNTYKMRLKMKEIQKELKTNIDIFKLSPYQILDDLSVSEFTELVNSYPFSYTLKLRLKVLEISFSYIECYEYCVPLRDWELNNKR